MQRKNHNNSRVAHLHEELAASRKWSLDDLAQRIVKSITTSQKRRSGSGGIRHDYVKAALYGRKKLSKPLESTIATLLEISPNEYRRRYAEAKSANVTVTANTVLPLAYWPHLAWKTQDTPVRYIATRLYGLSKNGVHLEFDVTPGHWKPPVGCSRYEEYREKLWHEVLTYYARMKKEPVNPKPVWHVARIVKNVDEGVKLALLQTDYRDVALTGSLQGLNREIVLDSGDKCAVQEWLAANWKPGDETEPVLPGARQLVVNLMVLTVDGRAVLSRQGADNLESANSWVTSVSVMVDPKIDSDNLQTPDISRAASRGCKEELGIDIDHTRIRWITVAAGLKYSSFTVFGVVETNLSVDAITESVKGIVARARSNPSIPCQVIDVSFLEISVESVMQRLATCDYRPYFELGLALLLWLKGQAEFVEYPNR